MKVYTFDSDTETASASATEATNRDGLYSAAFTDLPADTYIVQLETAGGVVRSFFWVTTDTPTGIYQAYDQPSSSVDTTAIANAVLAAGDIDGYSLEEALKLCAAVLAGKVSGAGTNTITFRAADDSKDRIVATVTSEGNRTSLVLDVTG
jgi:hypothetical protein